MAEYIKREDAISAACFGCNQQFSDEPCEPNDCALRQAINHVPSADVAEVRRGKLEIKYKFKNFFPLPLMDAVIACSVCGYEPPKYSDDYKSYNFCPMCGSRMYAERSNR